MLVVNSAFCASSALLLIYLAQVLGFPLITALLAALAYLADFAVSNLQLSALVDSAECFLMICVFMACLQRRWVLLPAIGILGALAKETILPLAFLFLLGWIWHEERKPWLWLVVMVLAAFATLILVRSAITGHLITPWEIATEERNVHDLRQFWIASISIVGSWTFWMAFVWMLPFAAYGMDRLPVAARSATLLAVAGALALSVWNWAGGNAVRPVFDVAAAYLCLAFSIGVTRLSAMPGFTARK